MAGLAQGVIAGLLVLIGFQLAGESLAWALNLPVPGAVIGMLLLLVALRLGNHLWPSQLAHAVWFGAASHSSKSLIKHLSLLFLPAGVGIFFLPAEIDAQWPAVLAAMVGGTFICMLLCAWLLRWLVPSRG